RIDGVGAIRGFGGAYAMRVWLDPFKLASYKLTPLDVRSAVLAQNAQVAAGELGGQPAVGDQQVNFTVTSQGRLHTAEQLRQIILRPQPGGGQVRLGDVARVEIGQEDYSGTIQMNGRPSAGVGIQLAPGANALKTADLVKKRVRELAVNFPPGVKYEF